MLCLFPEVVVRGNKIRKSSRTTRFEKLTDSLTYFTESLHTPFKHPYFTPKTVTPKTDKTRTYIHTYIHTYMQLI
jgi:hypothetical protein